MAAVNKEIEETGSMSAIAAEDLAEIEEQGGFSNWFVNKLSSAVSYIAKVGSELAVTLPKITEELSEVEKAQEQMINDVELTNLPAKNRKEIRPLYDELDDCIQKAKEFLQHCVLMANFCLTDSMNEAIEKELTEALTSSSISVEKFSNLCSFIKIFVKYFETCTEKMEEFEKKKKEVQKNGDKLMDKYIDKEEEAKTQKDKAIEEHTAHATDHRAELVHKISSLAIAEAAKGYVSADAAITLATTFTLSNFIAHIHEWGRALNIAKDKREIKQSETTIKTATLAQDEIDNFTASLRQIHKAVVHKSWIPAKLANTSVTELNKMLKPGTSFHLNETQHAHITTELNSIKRSMRSIQETWGTTGEHIDVALLIPNVKAQQDSDTLSKGTTLKLPDKVTIGLQKEPEESTTRLSVQVENNEDPGAQLFVPSSNQMKISKHRTDGNNLDESGSY